MQLTIKVFFLEPFRKINCMQRRRIGPSRKFLLPSTESITDLECSAPAFEQTLRVEMAKHYHIISKSSLCTYECLYTHAYRALIRRVLFVLKSGADHSIELSLTFNEREWWNVRVEYTNFTKCFQVIERTANGTRAFASAQQYVQAYNTKHVPSEFNDVSRWKNTSWISLFGRLFIVHYLPLYISY